MKKSALVTGSSDRIGKAISLALAKRGYHMILHYNSSIEKVEKLKKEIEEQYPVSALPLPIQFLEENDYNSIFQELKDKKYNIEVLVNCASDFQRSTFTDKGSELLHKQYKINFENPYLISKAYASTFESGHIINFLDTKVTKNSTDRLDYILSKKLLRDFTQLSAVELAPSFKVNAIAPGLVLPPPDQDEKYLLNLAEEIPLKTIGNVEEILKAFRFLLESDFVTGQILYIDGGDHLI